MHLAKFHIADKKNVMEVNLFVLFVIHVPLDGNVAFLVMH